MCIWCFAFTYVWLRVSDPLKLEPQTFLSCYMCARNLNPGFLEEQPVLLTSGPFPQILPVLATKCMNHRNLLVYITLISDPLYKCTHTMSTEWRICVILFFSTDTKGMRYNRQDLLLGLGKRGQPRSYPPCFFVKRSPWCLELSD